MLSIRQNAISDSYRRRRARGFRRTRDSLFLSWSTLILSMHHPSRCIADSFREREKKRETGGEERARCPRIGSMFHRAREIMARPAEPGCAVVFNWLTAIKFNTRVCFSSFILILRKSTPSPLSPLSSLECGHC